MEFPSLRSRLFNVLDVLLRLPPLFVMDELLRTGFGIAEPVFTPESSSDLKISWTRPVNDGSGPFDDLDGGSAEEKLMTKAVVGLLTKFLLCCAVYVTAFITFLLQTKHLLIVYMYLLNISIIFLSYWSNQHMTKTILQANGSESLLEHILNLNLRDFFGLTSLLMAVTSNYLLQTTLSRGFSYLYLGPRNAVLDVLLLASFAGPSFLAALPIPDHILRHLPVFSTLLPIVVLKYVLWLYSPHIQRVLYDGFVHARNYVHNFGLHHLLETEWMRLNVPFVLRTFWLVRVAEQSVALLMLYWWQGASFSLDVAFTVAKTAFVQGCETLTSVLGMTSMVSYICHYIGCFFQWVLLTEEEDDKSVGTVSAILFFILAMQTGLTTLEPEKRFVRLCRNFCLLFTALLHFVHNIVNPLLMSLSASHNPSLQRHIRALAVCSFLVAFPSCLLVYLWTNHAVNTWLLAVSAFSVEVVVKVGVSLLIYILFLVDACRNSFWEKLDDYVYYIRAFGNTVEFFFGIFLFFNGAWILIFESGGTIRAVMMCIHAYFNIWSEARAGWTVFMKRRTAVNKINTLPEATTEQLVQLDDVCAICYQDMCSAKITRCNHFFHSICLRKWLYVQDRCPLCHEVLYKADPDDGIAENPAGEQLVIPENVLD